MTNPLPVLYGASYSVYVRAARLALTEKGVAYQLEPVDVFAPGGVPKEHLKRHPFGKIPAFEHGDVMLYESTAILQYADEAFEGPALQPTTPLNRARMTQVISIVNNYVYTDIVWGLFTETVQKPALGLLPDAGKVEAATIRAETCLQALAGLTTDQRWLGSPDMTLADLLAAPMFALFSVTPPLHRYDVETHGASGLVASNTWSAVDDKDATCFRSASVRRTPIKKTPPKRRPHLGIVRPPQQGRGANTQRPRIFRWVL